MYLQHNTFLVLLEVFYSFTYSSGAIKEDSKQYLILVP